jgi:hypothetical protein
MNKIDIKNRLAVINDFAEVINKHSLENGSNTPDFILAEYLVNCLESYNYAVLNRNDWFYRPNFDAKDYVINPMEPNSAADDDDDD